MSISLNGTNQEAAGDRAWPTGAFTVVLAVRWPSDPGANAATFIAANNAGANLAARFQILASDSWRVDQGGGNTPNSTTTLTFGPWHLIAIRYTAEDVGGDGQIDGGVSTDGAAFDEEETLGSLSDIAAGNYGIGNERPDGAGAFIAADYAMFKVFDSVLTDEQVFTEVAYRNPQVAAWASHVFKTGALATDDSGNARDLTLTGSPTFTADEPSWILGDDPAAGSALPLVNAGLVNTGRIGSPLVRT